jgi:hypothetical protein
VRSRIFLSGQVGERHKGPYNPYWLEGLLGAQAKGQAGSETDRIAGRAMNAGHDGSGGRDAGFKIVLCFVKLFVRQVVDVEAEVHPATNLFGGDKIHDIEPRSANRGNHAVETVVANVAPAERTENAVPSGEGEAGILHGVRRAIHVKPRQGAAKERLRNLREAGIDRQIAIDADGAFALLAVAAAGPL